MRHTINFTACLSPKTNELSDLLIMHKNDIIHMSVLLYAEVYSGWFALSALSFWIGPMFTPIRALFILFVAGSRWVKCAVLTFCVWGMDAFLFRLKNHLVKLFVFCFYFV